jgi:fructose-1,6-bisphosphatase/inositol monophosphatase family enzyme
METYKNIDEFIMDNFPQEDWLIKQRGKSDIGDFIEKADAEFEQKLAEIIEGKKEEQKETP